jgi:hypothetical protein
MPRGPKGEKRLADVVGNAVLVMKIATGEVEDTPTEKNPSRQAWRQEGRQGARKADDAEGTEGDCSESRKCEMERNLGAFLSFHINCNLPIIAP